MGLQCPTCLGTLKTEQGWCWVFTKALLQRTHNPGTLCSSEQGSDGRKEVPGAHNSESFAWNFLQKKKKYSRNTNIFRGGCVWNRMGSGWHAFQRRAKNTKLEAGPKCGHGKGIKSLNHLNCLDMTCQWKISEADLVQTGPLPWSNTFSINSPLLLLWFDFPVGSNLAWSTTQPNIPPHFCPQSEGLW